MSWRPIFILPMVLRLLGSGIERGKALSKILLLAQCFNKEKINKFSDLTGNDGKV